MKNLLNPTPAQIKYRNRLWAKALEENPKKARKAMRRNGGRCCLAVAEDVAKSCGVKWRDSYENNIMPMLQVSKFFGWENQSPVLNMPNGQRMPAFRLNDGYKSISPFSHKQIAECVRNTFVHPKNPKWKLVK